MEGLVDQGTLWRSLKHIMAPELVKKTGYATRGLRGKGVGLLMYPTYTAGPALRAPCPRAARDGFFTASQS